MVDGPAAPELTQELIDEIAKGELAAVAFDIALALDSWIRISFRQLTVDRYE